ncbi:MAG: hypothetical protein ACKO0M_05980, partial [Cyanobium sp.]
PPCWWSSPVALMVVFVVGLLGCLPAHPPGPEPGSAPQPSPQQREQAMRRCLQGRQALMQGLRELRRAEAALAELNSALQSPAGPPRPVWDEEKEQRYSQEDQQLDRQRYEQELAAWQQQREGWQRQQRQLQARAQRRLDRQSAALHQRYPTLFTGPESIELNPLELERLSRCPPAGG